MSYFNSYSSSRNGKDGHYYQPQGGGDNTCMFGSVRPVPLLVCGGYVVHHFNGTELCFSPLICVMHHGAQGRPIFFLEVGGAQGHGHSV